MFSSSLLSNGVYHTPVPPLFFVTFPPFRATRWYIKLSRLRLTSNEKKEHKECIDFFYLLSPSIWSFVKRTHGRRIKYEYITRPDNCTRIGKLFRLCGKLDGVNWFVVKTCFPLAGNSERLSSIRNIEFSASGKLVVIKFDF